ncbi:MAG TPA: ABC transporter substrate-binding protein [Candidatus Binatia bacterium]
MKLRRSFFIFILCLSAVGSACGKSTDSGTSPGTLVVALESGPTHLDPRYAMDADSDRISGLIFNSLVRPDENSLPRPELAESWRAVDERTYIFHIRKGVLFHDGKPLTAADVKYTYQSILDPNSRSPKRGPLKFIEGIDQLGDYEIRFRLARSFAPFLENLTIGIVPAATPAEEKSGSLRLIGSGPFTLGEFSPGERVVLKANPSYWEGAPALSGVVFKIIPDAVVRALEFRKGTVDFIQNDLEPEMLPWLSKNTGATTLSEQGTTFHYLGMNLDHPMLSHRAVREAIGLAIDRDAVIHHIMKDLVVPATGLLSPRHWAYEPAVARLSYNPEKAKRLLNEAGFPDPDGDGPLPRFRLSYKTTNLDLTKRIAETLKEQLARVGIEIEVRTYEWGTFYGDVKNGNFHLFSLDWVGVLDPDIYYDLFHSSSVPPNGRNRGRYRNQELDRLLERGRQTVALEERRRIYSRVQEILAVDLPYIPLWWKKNIVVMKPSVRGFVPFPDGDFISLKKVSLSTALPPT